MNKQGLVLDKVVLLGRTFEEYVRYFALDPVALRDQAVLDVASGVSSFCAEANAQGIHVTAFDIIYELPPEQIEARCGPDLDHVTKSIGGLQAYKWGFYKNPETMRTYRERAYKTFLADYRAQDAFKYARPTPSLPRSGGEGRGEEAPVQRQPADEFTSPSPQPSPRAMLRREGAAPAHPDRRYVSGSLPHLPFRDGQFDLTLSSYLLFVYEDHFDYDFHKQSLLEIMRVTRGEARFYPLVSFEAKRCSYLDPLKNDPELRHLIFEEVRTDFEFLVGSNWFLRIGHRR